MSEEMDRRQAELNEAQEIIRRLEEQLKQLQAAKEELEDRQKVINITLFYSFNEIKLKIKFILCIYSSQELTVMMEKLERSQEMEAAERAKLEQEIRAKKEEVSRIQQEVEVKDAEARRLQEEVEAARYL